MLVMPVILPYLIPPSLRQTNDMRFRLNTYRLYMCTYIPVHCLLVCRPTWPSTQLPTQPLTYPLAYQLTYLLYLATYLPVSLPTYLFNTCLSASFLSKSLLAWSLDLMFVKIYLHVHTYISWFSTVFSKGDDPEKLRLVKEVLYGILTDNLKPAVSNIRDVASKLKNPVLSSQKVAQLVKDTEEVINTSKFDLVTNLTSLEEQRSWPSDGSAL